MQTNTTDRENGHDSSTEIDDRTRRALTQYLTVTPDVGRARGADGLVIVTSQSGSEYLVDADAGRCECPDAEYNLADDEQCKHVRRARFATGRDAIPAAAATDLGVDNQLGEHTDATLQFVAADGGVVTGDGAEILDESDADPWDGPHTEYDQYGQPTGAKFVRCRDCGVEVLDGHQDDATHYGDCDHAESGVTA